MKRFFALILTLTFYLASTTAVLAQDESDFARVGGTFDNMIEAALCNTGGSELMSPDVTAIVGTGDASMEMTTVGNCVSTIPGTNPEAGGALQMMGKNLAGIMTTQPISANTYIADVTQSLTGAKPAYAQAQGVGFNVLDSILEIWKAFRNTAYMIYILIFVVVGFMIMFRTKIDPQTVVSIQVALPRLIITLVLITFSYAIAGLLIDLMYIIIYVSAALLDTNGIFEDYQVVAGIIFNYSVFGIIFPTDAADTLISNPSDAAGSIVENLIGGYIGGFAGWITEHLTRLIFAAVALFAAIKLFISLGLSFVKIILMTIFAPLILLLNAFPGSTSFSTWFRGLLANVMVFPAIALLFMVAAAVIGPSSEGIDNTWGVSDGIGYGNNVGGDGWAPPFLLLRGGATGPSASAIGALIGYFMIIMSPQVATMINEFFKGSQFNYSSAIGQSLGQGMGALTAPYRHWRAQGAARKQNEALGATISRNIHNTGRTGPDS